MTYYSFKNNIKTGFNLDFFPPYLTGDSALSYDEWAAGKDANPITAPWDPNDLVNAHFKKAAQEHLMDRLNIKKPVPAASAAPVQAKTAPVEDNKSEEII